MAQKKTEVISVEEARILLANGTKAKVKVKRKKSEADRQLEEALQQHRIKELNKATGEEVVAEHRFHPEREWRFDFYLPQSRVAIEVEGGVWTQGRHTRGKGYIGDMEKYNSAQTMGIKVLRFTPDQLLKPKALKVIRQALNQQ
ncbi:hypothetical protein CLV24_11433 [Pontibacter ummariensis]|uniref:DUF559 domain-containing protein n=1 Tax=Pontibacter ummariensis TaxID=1610492 RepID=A0A239HKB4_9BACT|nr:endonuclease domain-containing protein [Pontibacter ummariensis]PRY10305.1 hypothetical protein CLV24_11433 [Pontibacter ummariensis]SNS81839.1 hypothetical protein SAMN06296052_11433 [Pontibacter ummariensis]